MTFFDYKKIRLGVLAITGFAPLFLMTLAMGLRLTWIGGAIVGLGGMIVIIFIGNILLTKNAWVRAIEREGILLLDLTSAGVIPTGIARLQQNKFGQKLFCFKQGDEEVTRLYDREVGWTLKEPLEGAYQILRDKETGKKLIQIQLEEDTFAKSVFFTDYMQCLIFNSQSGSFLTKSELGDNEREKLITYLTLNEQRELRELRKTLTEFMRDYANRLQQILGGLVNSNGFKILIIIFILIFIAALLWFFVPGFKETIMGAPKAIEGIIPSGKPVTSLT